MQFVDTHCHLTFPPLESRLESVVSESRERGVTRIVVPAYDSASWPSVIKVMRYEGIYGALGLHPWVSAEPLDMEQLEKHLSLPGVVAVGEIGLDHKVEGLSKQHQLDMLVSQLDMAAARKLPVLLHCRGAFELLLEILKNYQGRLTGVIHGFSRGPELAMRFVNLGFHIGLGGAITRPNAKRARLTARTVPLENIVLETDAPSIGLDGVPSQQVTPAHVVQVAETLAQIRDVEVQTVAFQTTRNGESLFQFGK